MRIAIYSRKSKWTGKGESIENQLIMCKEYILANIPGVQEEDITYYEDEGFSGKNIHRPQFQKMLQDLKRNHYDYLVCYKLDRLGRNLSDFVNLIEELNRLGTSFISIKERFDTSTPIGRAMMYFTGVLAQMEREQIAERVRDNMLMLARSGRWLGGATPLGFRSIKEEQKASGNKVKTSYRLMVEEEEMDTVRFIYQEFLKKQSLSQLVTYFLQNNIRTKNDKEYQVTTIRDILTNPVYCTSDREAYNYFEQLGCQVCVEEEELDGIHGFIGYGKTSSSRYKNKQNEPSEWIISTAKHRGVISGADWVKVQQILERNKKKGESFRKVQNPVSLLSGLLYCKCGSPMRPKNYRIDRREPNGDRTFVYLCSLKEKSNRKNCTIPNVAGNILDQFVLKEILTFIGSQADMHFDKGEINNLREKLTMKPYHCYLENNLLQRERQDRKERIQKLLVQLSKSDGDDSFTDYVREQINQLDKEWKEIDHKLASITDNQKQCPTGSVDWVNDQDRSDREQPLGVMEKQLGTWNGMMETLSIQEKREYLHAILDKIIWDGENAHVFFRGSTIPLPQPLGPTMATNSPSLT
jgi:site-specific DNA recombinase